MKLVGLWPKTLSTTDTFYAAMEKCLTDNHLGNGQKVGVVTVIGNAEGYDLRHTNARENAQDVDAIALNFFPTVTFPDSDKLYDDKARASMDKVIGDHQFLYQTPLLLRQFILGIEVQLGRRVIVAGYNKKWIVVPIHQSERHQAPMISDNDLAHLIQEIWAEKEGNMGTVAMFAYLKEMNRYTTDLDQITRVYNVIRTTGNLYSEDNP